MKDDFPSFYCKDMCTLVLLLFIEFLILHVATTLETALFLAEVNLTWGSTYFNFLLHCVCPRGVGAPLARVTLSGEPIIAVVSQLCADGI